MTVLLEEPEALDAETIQEDEKTAKVEAEQIRPGLTMFTDGSRLDSGATGYAVAWQNGQSWVGINNHMGYNQEAYDAECAALARALEEAANRQTVPEQVTIFTDAQAAIRLMASEEPGPGQKYTIPARRHIAKLRRARLGITIDIWLCPAHKGVPGNKKANEWAKMAAEKPEARGVEWLQGGTCPVPLPRSLAHIKHEISTKKWDEARQWAGKRISTKKYRMPRMRQPDKTVAGRTHQVQHHPTDETQRQNSPRLSTHTSNFAITKTSQTSQCPAKRPNRTKRPRWWLLTSTSLLPESWWET